MMVGTPPIPMGTDNLRLPRAKAILLALWLLQRHEVLLLELGGKEVHVDGATHCVLTRSVDGEIASTCFHRRLSSSQTASGPHDVNVRKELVVGEVKVHLAQGVALPHTHLVHVRLLGLVLEKLHHRSCQVQVVVALKPQLLAQHCRKMMMLCSPPRCS